MGYQHFLCIFALLQTLHPIQTVDDDLYVNSNYYHYYSYEEEYGGESTETDNPVELPPEDNPIESDYSDLNSEPDFNFPNIPWYGPKPRYNYHEALAKSMLFYEAQRSGPLPDNQRVKWRGDSGLDDGMDVGRDLTGGYYDGAGYVKYGFSMAFTTTVLSWGAIRYRRAYEIIGQLDEILDTIKWATDYFVKCHTSKYEFYGQVGDKPRDSQYFGKPEGMNQDNYPRKSYKISAQSGGADLAGETAAALASASIVFQPTDPEYSALLLSHAEELYEFAVSYQAPYSRTITVAEQAYGSKEKGFKDELSWASAWLYRRTGKQEYLQSAKKYYQSAKMKNLALEFSWSEKRAGVQMLLSEILHNKNDKLSKQIKMSAKWFCEHAQPEHETNNNFQTKSSYTPGGLLFINQWGPLRYAANTAFLCFIAADLGIGTVKNRVLAKTQMDYILGDAGRSFVVGFGNNPPLSPFHKSSYCPPLPEQCPRFKNEIKNRYTLYGAVVGGPGVDDSFDDERSDERRSSVTIDYNAGYQSALAALIDVLIFGDQRRPRIDKPGTITVEKPTLPPPTAPSQRKKEEVVVIKKNDYAEIVKKSLLFFEAQRSGILTADNRIAWREDSCVSDGIDIGRDLAGGYYDGFTHVKFGLPMSFSTTMLAWSISEFTDAYKAGGQLRYALDALKWGTDYILKSVSSGEGIVGQIGDPDMDLLTWDRPENINTTRSTYLLSLKNPGTDIFGEMAAALAASSLVFKTYDPRYSNHLLNMSEYVFDNFVTADSKGLYHDAIPSATNFYKSSGYEDEIAWGAIWLYKANKKTKYYQMASARDGYRTTEFSWNDKTAGVHLLKSTITKKPDDIAKFCDWLLDEAPRTKSGLIYLDREQPAKYAANAAFILSMAFKNFMYNKNAIAWRDLAQQQVDYLIGRGRTGLSFVVGHGGVSPTQPQHKGSSCPDAPAPCGFKYRLVDEPNPQVLVGALVGGPNQLDEFADQRVNNDQSRVSLDGNAGLQAAAASLRHLQLTGYLNKSSTNYISSCTSILLFSLLSTCLIMFQ